ncbi:MULTISPECIES: hypothetical protein [unclassified Mangrovimonas]|uniref:hypothetical protein n=1 Tax=unclassified Mangrovimonas TaxID=2622855 RepID=UPI0006B40A10|nr:MULTISPECIES: hypothetical protein [unclassified Mangrovimonas]OMP30224.1 hypothetical protein BKM32_12640 [Mangrovimonas sp. DI 80]WMI68047.1 hypothetical protein RBH95_12940 [Mangrovimonas sp. YM274]
MVHFLYFDPGLGAMVVQAVIAAVAGVVLFSKNLMFKIKSLFGFSQDKNEELFDDIDVTDKDIENTENSDR